MNLYSLIIHTAFSQEPEIPESETSESEEMMEEMIEEFVECGLEEGEEGEEGPPHNPVELITEALSSLELHDGAGIRYSLVYAEGEESRSLGQEYTNDIPFEIGSVSKVFTSFLLADMVARGEVTLDTTIRDILPDVKMRDDVAAITLKQLSTHSSGLPRMPSNLGTFYILRHAKDPYAKYDRKRLHKALSKAKRTEEGSAYSNFGAGLLGDLLSIQAGKDYCTLIEERISQPFKLDSLQCSEVPANLAQPHLWTGDPNPAWNFDALAGAGALRVNTSDLAFFLITIDALFKESALQNGHHISLKTHYKDERDEMGLGWMISEIAEERCYWHNGMTGGTSSFVGFCPEQEFGVILLMNQSDPKFNLTAAGMDSIEYIIEYHNTSY